MAKVSLNTCCGCVELRVGCFIIAYLGLIGSGMSSVQCIMYLIMGPGGSDYGKSELAGHRQIIADSTTVTSIKLAFHIFSLILSFVLLIGMHENKPGLVKFYLICNMVYLLISAVLVIITLFIDMLIIVFVTYLIFFCIWIYLFLVIGSYYYRMLDNRYQISDEETTSNYSQDENL